MERYDTLCDVNLSCTAAVDILNDMLCYEKLQSGILGLNKENFTVSSFLSNCVAMFGVQARECGVTVLIDGDTIGNGSGSGDSDSVKSQISPSILPDDTIYADKFKMDQVMRNLISNALKFTPRGGAVTIKATFSEMTEEELKKRSRNNHVNKRNLWYNFRKFFRRKNSVGIATEIAGDEKNHKNTALLGKLVMVVKDTGVGMTARNQDRLFKEIVQFNPEKLQAGGGSGLGLWITGGIVDLHDGKISASSGGEGMGSSFSVEIPMIRWPSATLPTPRRSPFPPPPSISTVSCVSSCPCPVIHPDLLESKIPFMANRHVTKPGNVELPRDVISNDNKHFPIDNISSSVVMMTDCAVPTLHALVVDDSSLNRKMLLKCLRAAGHVCTEAADGLEAVEQVKRRIGHSTGCLGKPFDAILMDFVMPNMDGPTATKEIRALGYTAPIFGVTGNGKCSVVWCSVV